MPDAQYTDRLQGILLRLREFRESRNLQSAHTPKELAAAIAIEAAELQELFLWRTHLEHLSDTEEDAVAAELADIVIYCLNFADVSGIDLLDAVEAKIRQNEQKYPEG